MAIRQLTVEGRTYYFYNDLINKKVILNRAKDYHENNNELLRERAKNKYKKLSEEEKNIKREYGKKDIIACRKKIKED